MPGANYMGGKRNAARARTKDVTSRLQKGHFGKQRLNILAHGIVGMDTRALKHKLKTTSIDFAHARREQPTAILSTPAISKDLKSHNPSLLAQSPLLHSKPSKLLTALEKLEPISFFSKKNRLLKISDFAGLITTPAETVIVVDKKLSARFPAGKRKVSDLFPRDIEEKQKLLTASDDTDGSSSLDFLTSPSPACPAQFSAACSNSSIDSFQIFSGSSKIGRPRSTCEKPSHHNFDQRCGDTESFTDQDGPLETLEISEAVAHLQPETFPVVLLEMSKEWREMADYLRVNDCQRQLANEPQRSAQVLGRLGVDFHVFPHLKPLNIDRSIKTFTTTGLTVPNDPSDFSLATLTLTQSVPPKLLGGIACPSVSQGAWIGHQSNDSSVLIVSSSVASPLPVDTCFPNTEVLEYDTQAESQHLPISAGQASQSLLDNALIFSSVPESTPSLSINTTTSNNKRFSVPDKQSHAILMSQDTNAYIVDPFIEDSSQSIGCHARLPSKSSSWDPSTGESHLVPHGHAPELEDHIEDASVRPPEDPEEGNVTTEPEGGAASYSRKIATRVIGISSIDSNINMEIPTTGKSLHPVGDAAAGNTVQILVFEDHTELEATLGGEQTTCLDYTQGESAGSKVLIEGPLLFAIDDEEVEDGDYETLF